MSGPASNYVSAAVRTALDLAQARTGRDFPDVPSAVGAGAITDADWCRLLNQARADADMDGTRLYARRMEEVLETLARNPQGLSLEGITRRLGCTKDSARSLVENLVWQRRLREHWNERGYRRFQLVKEQP